MSLLHTFYKLGVRMIGPVHSANNQFADSSTDAPKWRGLSPLGRELIKEAGALGMVLDASHASDAVLEQMLTLSPAPIMLSHSGVKAVHDHPRNVDDDLLRRLAQAGGVLQVFAVSDYLLASPHFKEREQAFAMRSACIERASAAEAAAIARHMHEVDERCCVAVATFDHFMSALLHATEVAGVDHVGIGCDWDGGAGLEGFEDVSKLPKITARLRAEGYSPEDIGKIMGGNALRVMRRAQACAHPRAGV
jgi:membrane dipeptidase